MRSLGVVHAADDCKCCRHGRADFFPHTCLRCYDMRCPDTAAIWSQPAEKNLEMLEGFINTMQLDLRPVGANWPGPTNGSRRQIALQRAMEDLNEYWDMGDMANA